MELVCTLPQTIPQYTLPPGYPVAIIVQRLGDGSTICGLKEEDLLGQLAAIASGAAGAGQQEEAAQKALVYLSSLGSKYPCTPTAWRYLEILHDDCLLTKELSDTVEALRQAKEDSAAKIFAAMSMAREIPEVSPTHNAFATVG